SGIETAIQNLGGHVHLKGRGVSGFGRINSIVKIDNRQTRSIGGQIEKPVVVISRIARARSWAFPGGASIKEILIIDRLARRASDVNVGDIHIGADQTELVSGADGRVVGHCVPSSPAVEKTPRIHDGRVWVESANIDLLGHIDLKGDRAGDITQRRDIAEIDERRSEAGSGGRRESN